MFTVRGFCIGLGLMVCLWSVSFPNKHFFLSFSD